jgi:hypothetical protein
MSHPCRTSAAPTKINSQAYAACAEGVDPRGVQSTTITHLASPGLCGMSAMHAKPPAASIFTLHYGGSAF